MNNAPPLGRIGAVVVIFIAAILLVGSCTVISPGNRGVRVSLGKVSPEPVIEGWTLKMPLMTTIHEVNIQQQTASGKATCYSSDLQTVEVTYALLYKLPASEVVNLYQSYRGDPFSSLIEPRLQEAIKQVTAIHKAEEVVQKRDVVRQDALKRMRDSIGSVIDVVDFNIVNIDLSDQLEHAIEQKMVEQQKALAKTYELDRETKQAEITLVQAKAEAQSIEVKAAALAKSPNVIDLEIVKKWDGRSPSTVVVGNDAPSARIILPVGTSQRPAKTP